MTPDSPEIMPTFLNLENNASSSLRAAHAAGDGSLKLKAGDGPKFGSTWPARVVVVHATSGAVLIYRVSGRAGDDLTVDAAIEGTADAALPAASAVEMRWTKGAIEDITAAIGALSSGGIEPAGSVGQLQVSLGADFGAIGGNPIGADAVAIGVGATAVGVGSVAVDGNGAAFGSGTLAGGDGSLAVGLECVASAASSQAIGAQCTAGYPPVSCTISGTAVAIDPGRGDVTAQFPVDDPIGVAFYRLSGGAGPSAAAGTIVAASYDGTRTNLTLQAPATSHTSGYVSCTGAAGGCFAAGGGNTASGFYSAALGEGSTATAMRAIAAGYYGYADLWAKFALGGGNNSFGAAGNCQASTVVLSGASGGTSPVTLTLGGIATTDTPGSASNLPLIRAGIAYAFDLTVIGRKSDGSKFARFKRSGLIQRTGNATALVGSVDTIGVDNNAPGWSIAVAADDVDDALQVRMTGEAGVGWVARLDCVEVG